MQPLAAVSKTAARMQCRPRREGKGAMGRTKAYESGEVQTVGRCGECCLRNLELEVLRVRGSKAGETSVGGRERKRKSRRTASIPRNPCGSGVSSAPTLSRDLREWQGWILCQSPRRQSEGKWSKAASSRVSPGTARTRGLVQTRASGLVWQQRAAAGRPTRRRRVGHAREKVQKRAERWIETRSRRVLTDQPTDLC